ncbi:helix-turn-helix domain-containing protein [Luteimonas sp. TWI662]|uniref:helix-turn-helix domain-containing protein n=1 Tax=Luteimonas sp. TWI662 TaxID=3136789 RepID=UPI003207E9F3
MSTIVMSACWPLQGMSVAQKMVLISLADQANDDGVCWPGIKSIGKRAALSERAVQEALVWLEAVGLITKRYRANASTSYTVTPDAFDISKAPAPRARRSAGAKASKATGADGAPPADGAPGADDAPPPADGAPGGADGAPPGVQMAHPNRQITITEPSGEPSFATGLPAAAAPTEDEIQAACRATWASYASAYQRRYGAAPVRNAKVNRHVRDLVKRLGRHEAAPVAAWFLAHVTERQVVQGMHDLGLLLARAEGYRTLWATGRTMTETQARQADRTQSNASAADQAVEILMARRSAHAG